MPKVTADPEEIEHFAKNLKQFNAELSQRMSQLQAEFANLGDTWRDQEQTKFAQEFQQTMQVLRHLIQTTDTHIPFLMRKAQRIRDYLNQR